MDIVRYEIMESLYNYIFKRKSFHLFRNKTKEYYKDSFHIQNEELDNIYKYFNLIKPLISNVKVSIKIVKEEMTNCKRGAEYFILFYFILFYFILFYFILFYSRTQLSL